MKILLRLIKDWLNQLTVCDFEILIQDLLMHFLLTEATAIILSLLQVYWLQQQYWVKLIEMKGITRCKLTIISESAVCKKFLGQIVSYPASL